MSINVAYQDNESMLVRFRDHLKLGFYNNIGTSRAQPNLCEKAGDKFIELGKVPYHVLKGIERKMQDPRYVTVGLTAIALGVTTAIHYPTWSRMMAEKAVTHIIDFIQNVDLFEKVRFASYATTVSLVLGGGLRAEGRFTNAELMQQFYDVRGIKGNPAGMTNSEIVALKA